VGYPGAEANDQRLIAWSIAFEDAIAWSAGRVGIHHTIAPRE
jgi:hypothetical protein